jgi:hypothetical protein
MCIWTSHIEGTKQSDKSRQTEWSNVDHSVINDKQSDQMLPNTLTSWAWLKVGITELNFSVRLRKSNRQAKITKKMTDHHIMQWSWTTVTNISLNKLQKSICTN